MLKLDLDGKKNIENRIRKIRPMLQIAGIRIHAGHCRIYETAHGFHAHIKIYNAKLITDLEIVAIQSILGSDPYREMHNFARVIQNEKQWNVLFDQKFMMTKGKLSMIHRRKRRRDLEVML